GPDEGPRTVAAGRHGPGAGDRGEGEGPRVALVGNERVRRADRARLGALPHELDRREQARRARIAGARQELAHLEVGRGPLFELAHDLHDARLAVDDARVALLRFDGARLDRRRIEPAGPVDHRTEPEDAPVALDRDPARHQTEEALESVAFAERVDQPP